MNLSGYGVSSRKWNKGEQMSKEEVVGLGPRALSLSGTETRQMETETATLNSVTLHCIVLLGNVSKGSLTQVPNTYTVIP